MRLGAHPNAPPLRRGLSQACPRGPRAALDRPQGSVRNGGGVWGRKSLCTKNGGTRFSQRQIPLSPRRSLWSGGGGGGGVLLLRWRVLARGLRLAWDKGGFWGGGGFGVAVRGFGRGVGWHGPRGAGRDRTRGTPPALSTRGVCPPPPPSGPPTHSHNACPAVLQWRIPLAGVRAPETECARGDPLPEVTSTPATIRLPSLCPGAVGARR